MNWASSVLPRRLFFATSSSDRASLLQGACFIWFGCGRLFESFLVPIRNWLVGTVIKVLLVIVPWPSRHSNWSKDRHVLGQSKSFQESPLFIGFTDSKDKVTPAAGGGCVCYNLGESAWGKERWEREKGNRFLTSKFELLDSVVPEAGTSLELSLERNF